MAQTLDKSFNPNISVNRSQFEQAIYLEIQDDSRFPAVTSLSLEYPDRSTAFPANSASAPLSSFSVYPKFATLNFVVNTEEFVPGQSGFVTLTTAQTAYGTFNAIQILTTTVFDGVSANNSTIGALVGNSIPAGIIYGPYTGVAVRSGIVMLYRYNP